MLNEPASTPLPVDEQILHIRQLTGQIRAFLQNADQSLPSQIVETLDQLTTDLVRLGRQIEQRKEERDNLVALTEVSQAVNSTLDLTEVLRIVMDTCIRLTGAERGFLMLRNERGKLVTDLARNWEQESIDPSEFAVSRTIIDRVVNEGQAVLTTNAQEDPRFGKQESIIFHNLRSILCVPLKVKDELTGVIYVDNRVRSGIFDATERNLLAMFANQAAIAIENARLFESIRRTLADETELKNLMDNVFASIASGVITADAHDQITLCNRAAQSILKKDGLELLGHTLHEVLPQLEKELSAQVARVRRTGQSIVGLEYTPTLPQRGLVYLNLHLSPLINAAQNTQGIAIVMEDLTGQKRLEAQYSLFERMISPVVIDQLNPENLQLGGKRTAITTLFADLRGFTSFSEGIDPEELVSVLNCYLAAAAEAVLAQEGTIDKFLGDALMAWFNAPVPQTNHTLRAVRAALSIRQAVADLQCRFSSEYHLSFGTGIHFGEAVLGLVGTEKRLEYTAIGDSVNTAKRIQENAAAGQILISADAYALVKDELKVKPVEPVLAKGKRQPIQVYEVIGL